MIKYFIVFCLGAYSTTVVDYVFLEKLKPEIETLSDKLDSVSTQVVQVIKEVVND